MILALALLPATATAGEYLPIVKDRQLRPDLQLHAVVGLVSGLSSEVAIAAVKHDTPIGTRLGVALGTCAAMAAGKEFLDSFTHDPDWKDAAATEAGCVLGAGVGEGFRLLWDPTRKAVGAGVTVRW